MKIAYENWRPRGDSLKMVDSAESIIEEYRLQGFTLTLRQLYYQFVSRALIPNTERSYKNLGSLITKARMAGLVSWYAIEDRSRGHNQPYCQEDDGALIDNLQHYITFDQWERQDNYVEVWVEKEALGNVIAKACDPLMVPYLSCKGYLSASEAWRAGRRFKREAAKGKNCYMIHLGDHDPSGIDMTRDNKDRLSLFAESYGIEVNRIALNMDQVEKFDPPPNPTKLSDSRAGEYLARYGETCWELDALEPKFITGIITDEIDQLIDLDTWNDTIDQQQEVKDRLALLSDNWERIRDEL